MKKQFQTLFLACISSLFVLGQVATNDILLHEKDSALRVVFHADSLKIAKEYDEKARLLNIAVKSEFPLLKGGKYSGVLPVKNVDEIPDPNLSYKILFELTQNNPESAKKEINAGLDEIARIINLHIAAGIHLKNMIPVIVVHAGAINAIRNNEAYKLKYKVDNPNLKLIADLEKIGAKFIACGQSLEMFDVKQEELLPEIKISLSAQTVITQYQLKGYILRTLSP